MSKTCRCGAGWYGFRDAECRPICANCGSDATAQAWAEELERTASVIPAEWIFVDTEDGWQGILPEHADQPLVTYYNRLRQVGYARGWL